MREIAIPPSDSLKKIVSWRKGLALLQRDKGMHLAAFASTSPTICLPAVNALVGVLSDNTIERNMAWSQEAASAAREIDNGQQSIFSRVGANGAKSPERMQQPGLNF